jgi:hypothetical protein
MSKHWIALQQAATIKSARETNLMGHASADNHTELQENMGGQNCNCSWQDHQRDKTETKTISSTEVTNIYFNPPDLAKQYQTVKEIALEISL